MNKLRKYQKQIFRAGVDVTSYLCEEKAGVQRG